MVLLMALGFLFRKKPWLLAMAGLLVAAAIAACLFLWKRPAAVLPVNERIVLASFRGDFQPENPKAGWHYYWNQRSPVGDTNGYAELVWNGSLYGADVSGNYPAPPRARFLRLTSVGGHPGHGPAQTQGAEEFAVIIA